MGLIPALLIGALCGWLLNLIAHGDRYDLEVRIGLGAIGSVFGTFKLPSLIGAAYAAGHPLEGPALLGGLAGAAIILVVAQFRQRAGQGG